MKTFLNAALFQLLWFACLLGGHDWAVAAVVVYFVVHHYVFVRQNNEWWLIVLFVLLGVLIDGALIFGGWLMMPASIWTFPIPPPWLLGLWAGVGSLFFHCLAWGQQRPWLLSTLAALSVPFSYVFGARFADVSFGYGTVPTVLLIGFIWFWLMQVGVRAVQFLNNRQGKTS